MHAKVANPIAGERAPPRASALLESLRGFGYSLEAAIADLVDNSISARAHNVRVQFEWAGAVSWALILDDGEGMTEAHLVEAMRLGTLGPLAERSPTDLGRFGLGLKTASFSQCRCLTVATKMAGSATHVVRTWDLDFVAETDDWLLRRDISAQTAEILTVLNQQECGTAVVWQGMDRVVGLEPADDRRAEEHFLKAIDLVKRHLGMVFHRLLAGDSPIRIFVNGSEEHHRVRPWDPFLSTHHATQATPIESIPFKGEQVVLQGFVLPHHDRLTDSEYENAGGASGWNAQQGFYVYRNRRLLVAGGWLGLGDVRSWTREEQHKLARISVAFPNSLDPDWHIDVKKSLAHPPRQIRDRITNLARAIREMSRRVYAQRGRLPSAARAEDAAVRPWTVSEGGGEPRYRISRSHPLVAQLLAFPECANRLETLLSLIEMTVPVQRIWLETAEGMARQGGGAPPLLPIEDVLPVAKALFLALQDVAGISAERATTALLNEEPFCLYSGLGDLLVSE